jgi:hypothetical protein
MRKLSLHALRKQLRSEYAHAQWLIKQRAMHKQLGRCELRIAKLCVELDATNTSAQTKKEQPIGCSFHPN